MLVSRFRIYSPREIIDAKASTFMNESLTTCRQIATFIIPVKIEIQVFENSSGIGATIVQLADI